MFVVAAVVAILLALAGLAGCVLPVLPGPPLSYVGLFLVWAARGFDARSFGDATHWALLAATVLVTALDVALPVLGARRHGATRWGTWGSVVGMVVGLFAFPPFGLILGTFLGALVGELAGGASTGRSMKAAWGVFVGTMLGTAAKLAVSGALLWFVLAETFA